MARKPICQETVRSFHGQGGYFEGREVSSGVENLYRLELEIGLSLLLHSFPVFPSTVLVKRCVIETVGGWDARFRRCQDFDIGLRIARRFPLHYLDEVQAILGLHDGNDDAHAYIVKQTEGDIRVLSAYLKAKSAGSSYHRQVAEALGRKHCGLGYSHRKAGQYKLARQSYRALRAQDTCLDSLGLIIQALTLPSKLR